MRFGKGGGNRCRETPSTRSFEEANPKIGFANFEWQAYFCDMLLGKLLSKPRKLRHLCEGLQIGKLFEYRAIAIVILALVVGFAVWILLKKAERYSYTSQKMGQISTASGTE